MKRLAHATTLALVALLVTSGTSEAGLRWCYRDPIVLLNGTQVQILVAVPEDQIHVVNGPVRVTIAVPEGVDREVIFTDSGFNGFGETVIWETLSKADADELDEFKAKIRVEVPIDTKQGLKTISVKVETIVADNDPKVTIGTNKKTQLAIEVVSSVVDGAPVDVPPVVDDVTDALPDNLP